MPFPNPLGAVGLADVPRLLLRLIPRPRVRFERGHNNVNGDYAELRLYLGRVQAWINVDERGYALHIDEDLTNHFIEIYLDKPLSEITGRISYKE